MACYEVWYRIPNASPERYGKWRSFGLFGLLSDAEDAAAGLRRRHSAQTRIYPNTEAREAFDAVRNATKGN